jgi:flagellar biosynthesis/type III secretory pathway protein FliH
MSGFAERFIEQGVQQGIEQGVQQGESRVLLRLLTRRFGQLPTETVQRIEGADADTLLA